MWVQYLAFIVGFSLFMECVYRVDDWWKGRKQ